MASGYIPIAIAIMLLGGFLGGFLLINALLGPKRKTGIKGEPWECGLDQITSPRQQFPVKFIVVAIFFIVFDVEAVFIYLWAASYRDLLADPMWAMTAFVEMLLFILVLGFGLWYLWRRRALKWD